MLFGDYDLTFKAFTSEDGRLYDATDILESLPLRIHIDGNLGLTQEFYTGTSYNADSVKEDDRIIRLDEGREDIKVKVKTDRAPEGGYVTATLRRRNPTYDANEVYQNVTYTNFDLNRIVKDNLTLAETQRNLSGIFENYEYSIYEDDPKVINEDSDKFTIDLNLNLVENISDIPTGEYKFTFKVYSDENNLLETSEKTIVVVK